MRLEEGDRVELRCDRLRDYGYRWFTSNRGTVVYPGTLAYIELDGIALYGTDQGRYVGHLWASDYLVARKLRARRDTSESS